MAIKQLRLLPAVCPYQLCWNILCPLSDLNSLYFLSYPCSPFVFFQSCRRTLLLVHTVRNAHGNNIGAHEMVPILLCASDYPCWPMGMSSARIGMA